MRNAARTHEALPEQPTRDASHEAENGVESNARSVGLSAHSSLINGAGRALSNWVSLPPASRRKSIRKPKGPQDISGDEEENCASGSSTDRSGSVGPFFVSDRCATARDVQIDIGGNDRVVALFIRCYRRRSFPRNECGEESSSLGDIPPCPMIRILFRPRLEGEVVIFFKGDAFVMEGAHLRTSVCNNALACELALLVGETRVAAVEGHVAELRHVALVSPPDEWTRLACGVRRKRTTSEKRSRGVGRGRRTYLSNGRYKICRPDRRVGW